MGRKKHRSKKNNLSLRKSRDNAVCEKSTIRNVPRTDEEAIESNETRKGTLTDDKCLKKETIDHLAGISNGPIDVRSRLTYPLVLNDSSKLSLNESNRGDDDGNDVNDDGDSEEESVELNVKPRFVFVSSLCAVCLAKSRLFCERCRMVSYCCKIHRTQGSLEHGKLCETLTEIRWSIVSMLSNESGVQLDAEQYRVFRLKLLGIFESKIGRSLDLWEREIILYPRVCRICRRFSEKLICCTYCGMEYFCEGHDGEHKNWCEEFRILQRFLFLQHKYGYIDVKIPNVYREMLVARPEFGFNELMYEIYGDCWYYRKMDCYTYSTLSHLCTIPLTALYSMQISSPEWKNKVDCTIHMLGAEFQFEGINLHVWERMFLHFLPNLKKLCLILIGPELRLPKGVPHKLLSTVKVCKKCKSTGRAVVVSFKQEMLYHDLIRDTSECLSKPDLICVYNPGLYRKTGFEGKDTWLETIKEFCKTSIPVTVTSYTEDEMHWEITRINSIADIEILLQPYRNPFSSVKPDRNFVSDDTNPLIYKNYYIAIVKGKTILP
ncbi:hypothetical protein WN48_03170 [Eufriesea mexicana]|uniref:uncharacterized protein LOC108549326 n=1 Tax=Eufriesea mexicana TaxID=516756 RepID=UPI00083BA87E|nr:PREDICTED: uncharacterized protein LOC108549326 [Eufriesea mexicana]OAD56483.1 hypothetical protein WN48_03170 [Eufriesea mexicana]